MIIEKCEQWIRNLLSGKFSQSFGALKDGFGYCCLGVGAETVDPDQLVKGNYTNYYIDPLLGGYLNKENLQILGLTDDKQMELSNLNDNGENFRSIAENLVEYYKTAHNVDFSYLLKETTP